ncbi:MAG: hypothetical protein P0Y55_07420 [Candidatus Cohnella colombiensis]|uniref:Uncharacterized protein n=1 Tax=Candidatus Cohnella colombiensis TaxID=3121368 RepID=A0AA95F6G2_9BACL|nr:MAG: hypothetical protein P0Y55_07420 [Cohnella sp.]
MTDLSFSYYMQLENSEAERVYQTEMENCGYSPFYQFVEQFRTRLKSYTDTEKTHFETLLKRGRRLFPKPGSLSPAWSLLWDEFDSIFRVKNEVLATISEADRDGEWQIIIDNPFHTQSVVCYTELSFYEAAYMYGYFQLELKPNECLRLQKINQLLFTHGSKEASIFPST